MKKKILIDSRGKDMMDFMGLIPQNSTKEGLEYQIPEKKYKEVKDNLEMIDVKFKIV